MSPKFVEKVNDFCLAHPHSLKRPYAALSGTDYAILRTLKHLSLKSINKEYNRWVTIAYNAEVGTRVLKHSRVINDYARLSGLKHGQDLGIAKMRLLMLRAHVDT